MTKYAKVGEKVIVKEFITFERVGYPLTLDIVRQKFSGEVETALRKMEFILTTPRGPITEVFHEPPKVDSFVERQLVRAICGYIMRRENFGGRERKIFEGPPPPSTCEDQTGKLLPVLARRMVTTGTYYPAYGGGWGYSDYEDYEPAELCDTKQHCVYTLEGVSHLGFPFNFNILASHCEREAQ
jgi:hypothetical protein